MLKDERRVFALTLTDGAQAVVLLTLLPFILLRHVATTPSMGTTGLGALSAGFFLGIAGTLLCGRAADRWSAYAVLQLLQLLQIVTSVGLVLNLIQNRQVLSTFLVAIGIGLLRSSGPAKDKIRALHIPRDQRTQFNALVRRWFLVVNQTLVVVLTVIISILPEEFWPHVLLTSTLLVSASIVLTRSLSGGTTTSALNQDAPSARLSRPHAGRLSLAFLVIVILGLGIAIPTIGLTTWISLHSIPPWVLSAYGLYLVAFDFWFIKLLGSTLSGRPTLWGRAIQWGAVALLVGVVSSWLVGQLTPGWPAYILLLVVGPTVTAAASISVMFAMEIQYGFGEDSLRGRIASYTRICSAVGTAVASFIAPAIFLHEVVITTATLFAAGAALFLAAPAARRIHLPAV